MNAARKQTQADKDIQKCLEEERSFYVIAGAGSGKTTSLVTALEYIRDTYGMLKLAESLVTDLNKKWSEGNVGDVLRYCRDTELCQVTKKLGENLSRPARAEEYSEELHSTEKGEWLADEYFNMKLVETERYCEFVTDITAFSTQHGVKGEEYDSVLVVFDDVSSAWSTYSFSKMLTPSTAGEPTERQKRLSENLAYVCFSRAERDLRIIMFTTNAATARQELIDRKLFKEEQIELSA